MEKLDSVLVFSFFFIILIAMMALYYFFHERRKKEEIKLRFKDFKKGFDLSHKDLRAVPRISVPDSLDVILTLVVENDILKAYAIDISLTGFSVEPDFSLKKLALGIILKDVRVETAINQFFIKELKLLRKERRPRRRFMAFYINEMDENQFGELKSFIKYLDEFLIHEQNKD